MYPKLFTIPAFDLFGRHLGPFSLHMYGVLLVAALLAALWLAGRLAKKHGLDPQKVQDLGIASIIAGLVGAKLLLVVVDFDQYRASPRALLDVLQSGGVFYGGLIGALPVAWWYIRKHALPVFSTLDVMAPAVALGQCIGRLACFAAGCCFGAPSTLPWSVIFHSEDAHALVGVPLGVPLHPSQLYESLGTFLLLFGLLALLKKRRFKTDLVSLKIACLRQSKDGEQHAGLVRARPTTDAVWIQRTKCTKVLIKIGHLWDLRQR